MNLERFLGIRETEPVTTLGNGHQNTPGPDAPVQDKLGLISFAVVQNDFGVHGDSLL